MRFRFSEKELEFSGEDAILSTVLSEAFLFLLTRELS